MNHILDIFLESAWVASIIPGGAERTFFALAAFGQTPMFTPWLMAVLGATTGQLFNWFLGKIVYRLQARSAKPFRPETYAKAQRYFRKYGVFLLLLSWAPAMNLLVVAAGALQVPLRVALPLIMAGLAAAYGLPLL